MTQPPPVPPSKKPGPRWLRILTGVLAIVLLVITGLTRLGHQLIDTEMGKPLIEAGLTAQIPVGRIGTGGDIAQTVLLLVQNDFITGQTLAVNGGSLFS